MAAVMTTAAHVGQGLRWSYRHSLLRVLRETGDETARARPDRAPHVEALGPKPRIRQWRARPAGWPRRPKWNSGSHGEGRRARQLWQGYLRESGRSRGGGCLARQEIA